MLKKMALSAAVLLAATHVSATDLASVPLDTKAVAKPNVVLALDDSGSMDFEVLLNTNDGAAWWEANTKSFADASGNPHFNSSGATGNDGKGGNWYKYAYLFPNGTNSDARSLTDGPASHFAVPPVAAFAWLRSSDYNPLYYNPAVTYRPWEPAYIGSDVAFPPAIASAARSHPVFPTSGSATVIDLTQTLVATQANWTFRMLPGMVIPGGSVSGVKGRKFGGGSWQNISTSYTIPSGEWWDVSIPYYPATYYVKDAKCGGGADCFTGPDGTKLRRYEIKSGAAFPSGRSYAEELQNFANWFVYYRKRKLMLAAAAGEVFSRINGIRAGVVQLNDRKPVTMRDFSSPDPSKNARALLGLIYSNPASGGTPTREALDYVGRQYMRTDAQAPIQYACQRNSAFVLTDGFAYASAVTPPAYDQSKWVGTPPYQTIYGKSLADIAAAYYTVNLRPDLPNGLLSVDPSNTAPSADRNPDLHMTTYALALGAKGFIFGTGSPQDVNPFLNYPSWPKPDQDRSPSAIDDLWHATINGRGAMLNAASADTVVAALKQMIADMLVKSGSQSALAVSNVNLRAGDNTAYVASYNGTMWTGELAAYAIDPSTGAVDMSDEKRLWSARTQLDAKDWTKRLIATYSGGGVPFRWADLSATQRSVLHTPAASPQDGDRVLNWVRGDRSLEGVSYRARGSILGDIVNAEPVVVGAAAGSYADAGYSAFASGIENRKRVVYQAANDGMLHAFDAATGEELWGYVPSFVIEHLQRLSAEPYTHRFYVDATPTVADVDFGNVPGNQGPPDWRTILVGGLGAGGRGFYALDITDPQFRTENALANAVLWEFPSASTSSAVAKNVGYTFGRPVIAKTKAAGWVVLVTSGYNNTDGDGKGHLFVLSPRTGEVIADIATGAGSPSNPAGLAQISAWSADGPLTDFVYGADLLGNLWRFDLSGEMVSSWKAVKLATFADAKGQAQPVTAAAELVKVSGKRLIVVGTGRLLGEYDLSDTSSQSMYAVVDDMSADPYIADVRTALAQKTVTVGAGGIRNINSDQVDLSVFRGWYLDLPGAGERANTNPIAAFGAVIFTTNVPSAEACSSSSFLYVVGQDSGGQMPNSYFRQGEIPWSGMSLGTNMANRPVVVVTPTGAVHGLTHKSDNTIAGTKLPTGGSGKVKRAAWKEVLR